VAGEEATLSTTAWVAGSVSGTKLCFRSYLATESKPRLDEFATAKYHDVTLPGKGGIGL
jgi:hypothetical protein